MSVSCLQTQSIAELESWMDCSGSRGSQQEPAGASGPRVARLSRDTVRLAEGLAVLPHHGSNRRPSVAAAAAANVNSIAPEPSAEELEGGVLPAALAL